LALYFHILMTMHSQNHIKKEICALSWCNWYKVYITGCVLVAAITKLLLQLVLADTHQGWQKCCARLVSMTVYSVLF